MLGEVINVSSEEINFPWYLTIPRNLCNSLTDLSKGVLVIASLFEGPILIPFDKIMCPKNSINCFLIWHLVLFSFNPLSLIFKKTFFRHLSCSFNVFPHTTKSCWEFALSGMSKIIEVTSLWKTSLFLLLPFFF